MSPTQSVPKVSVIVPVYKVEKYLPECIESVLAQTFTDFELILVDDGSPDNSGKICDDYATRDSRIRVFHKENGGVSSARNLGLDNARGEWIGFVDPDDWIEPDMYEQMYLAGTENNADFVWCDFWTESDTMIVLRSQGLEIVDSENMIMGFLSGRLHGSVWCKLIRAAVLRGNGLYFSTEIAYCEDLLLSIELALKAKKIAHIAHPFYHYRVREGAATSSLNPEKALSDHVVVWDRVYLLLQNESRFVAGIGSACRNRQRAIEKRRILSCFEKFGKAGGSVFSCLHRFRHSMREKIGDFLFEALKKRYAREGNLMKLVITNSAYDWRIMGETLPRGKEKGGNSLTPVDTRCNRMDDRGGVICWRENILQFPRQYNNTREAVA
ncbi:MAG: glycosyltransferase [Opitutales bacterium]|nr:glycosyltransferase [Opitutales bacterium]